ncbi:hypothetical protein [Telmatospirillum sp. J64-1]|uniref:hypothetical protein n=1 Tax=Telmatospirillum sp. J64-1 TaxID=2502183 RepID=UPI00115CB867|nr:hypothetical protein [Telmatospirillum sp. J64-1]
MAEIDYERISRLEAQLLRQRIVYSLSTESRKTSTVEQEIAAGLQKLRPEEEDILDRLLAAKGYRLRREDQTFPGIPRGGQVWALVRRPDFDGPALLSMTKAWERLKLKQSETKPVTVYWFTLLWFLTMSFFYDRIGRGVSEVSRHIEPNFRREELEEKVFDHLEALRREGRGKDRLKDPVAWSLLEGEEDEASVQSAQVRRRVGRFLAVMQQMGMLDVTREGTEENYQQSLLCAMQIDELFSRDLVAFLPDSALLAEDSAGLADAVGELVHSDKPVQDESQEDIDGAA